MLDAFVSDILHTWESPNVLLAPPEPPRGLPYQSDQGSNCYQYTWVKLNDAQSTHHPLTGVKERNVNIIIATRVKLVYRDLEDAQQISCNLSLTLADQVALYFLQGETDHGERIVCAVNNNGVLEYALKDNALADMCGLLGRQCDEHNMHRALQYARVYIQ